jgi:hypothetical protein
VAYAWVLFEKCIYKGIVKKHNRKLIAVLCLLIALKCTEAYGGFKSNEERFVKLKQDALHLIETDHHHHQGGDRTKDRSLHRRPLIVYELKVLSALNFQTTVPLRFILPHMDSIMSILDTNMLDYLGEESYNEFIAQRNRWNGGAPGSISKNSHHNRRSQKIKGRGGFGQN